MNYKELVEKVTKAYASSDAGKIGEHAAIQFNIRGEGEGAFYIEIADGKVNVQPFEYYDRDATVTTTAETVSEIVSAALDWEDAYSTGKMWVEGNLDKVLLLKKVSVKKTRARKPKEESAEGQTKTTRKTTTKTAAKTEEKESVKKAAKTADKKPAKKAETKTEEKKPAKTIAEKAEAKTEKKQNAKKIDTQAEAEKEISGQMELKF